MAAAAHRTRSYKEIARDGIAACRAQLRATTVDEDRPALTLVPNQDDDSIQLPARRDIDG